MTDSLTLLRFVSGVGGASSLSSKKRGRREPGTEARAGRAWGGSREACGRG